jgi:hypothetical protein
MGAFQALAGPPDLQPTLSSAAPKRGDGGNQEINLDDAQLTN